MSVKIRLARGGAKKRPYYYIVAANSTSPRDGRYIEQLGRYDPNPDPSLVEIDADRAIDWLQKGAQPTDAVRKLLEISGTMSRFKVAAGRIHTVGGGAPAPAATEAPAPVEAPVEAEEPTAAEAEEDASADPSEEE